MSLLNSRIKNILLNQDRKRLQGILFVGILFALLAGITVTISVVLINMQETTRLENLERRMNTQLQNKASELTVWLRDTTSTIENFTLSTNIRLFISDIASGQTSFLPVQTGDTPSEQQQQVGLTQQRLSIFLEKNSFITAKILSASQAPILSVGESLQLSDQQRQLAKTVMETGKPAMLPIQIHRLYGATVSIFTPIFIQDYSIEDIRKSGAVLLTVIRANAIIDDIATILPMTLEQGATVLLEYQQDNLLIVPYKKNTTGWAFKELEVIHKKPTTNTAKILPFAKRTLIMPNGMIELAYSALASVQGTPWYLVQAIPIALFGTTLDNYRQTIMLIATFIIIITGIILAGLWWWLFERDEQKISSEIKRLHDTTTQQKQLLNSINTSISDGILLCSTKTGKILYANTAFANIADESVALLKEKSYHTLLSSSLNQCLEKLLSFAVTDKTPQCYTEKLTLHNQVYYYQISSTPYTPYISHTTDDYLVTLTFHDITTIVITQKKMQLLTEKVVQAFASSIEATDPYLSGHGALVARLSMALCHQMGEHSQAETVRLAALLSPIGMVYIPHAIRSKKEQFTQEERKLIETHIYHTLAVLEDIDFEMPVQEAIAHMHERLDGSGYPNKLSGDQISLAGRILAVATMFCARLRPRSYRAQIPLQEALDILSAQQECYDINVQFALQEFLTTAEGKHFCEQLIPNVTSA